MKVHPMPQASFPALPPPLPSRFPPLAAQMPVRPPRNARPRGSLARSMPWSDFLILAALGMLLLAA
jgi:hypothetical protein